MSYYKTINSDYIISIGIGKSGAEIAGTEYAAIMQRIQNKPADPEGYQYKLRADNLEWELVELPPVEPEPLTGEEALTRYANELTGEQDETLNEATETLIKHFKEDK